MLCRTEIREPDAAKTASVPAVERPGAGRSDCVCGAVANLPRRVGNCARNAAGKDGPPPAPAPPDAGPPASSACAVPRPARPSTGAPGSVPRNASRAGCAPSAASIATSRTGGCAGPAGRNAGPPSASDTAAPGEPVSNTVADESAPGAGKDAGAAASGGRPRTLAGLCVRCGRNAAVEGGSSCEPCLEKRRVLDREQYRSRRDAGCCGRCGVPTFQGAPVCGPCAVIEARRQPKKNATARRRYAERRSRWICTACGRKPSFGASRCENCSKLEYERSEHVRGIPDWEPGCTVVDRFTGEELSAWDRWEDAVASLSFAGLSLDDVELLSETSPLHTMTGWG